MKIQDVNYLGTKEEVIAQMSDDIENLTSLLNREEKSSQENANIRLQQSEAIKSLELQIEGLVKSLKEKDAYIKEQKAIITEVMQAFNGLEKKYKETLADYRHEFKHREQAQEKACFYYERLTNKKIHYVDIE